MKKQLRIWGFLLLVTITACHLALVSHGAPSPSGLSMQVTREGTDVVLGWAQDGARLESSSQLGGNATWATALEATQLLNGLNTVRLRPGAKPRFFRLRAANGPILNVEVVGGGQLLLSWENPGPRYTLEVSATSGKAGGLKL